MPDNYAELSRKLLEDQRSEWNMCGENYDSLSDVQVKEFDHESATYKIQFNPARMTSTAAKVDTKSIKERKCFLCAENRPEVQRGVDFDNKYIILCNPMPIFPEHFTLTHKEHVPQRIVDTFPEFLKFTKELGERYTVFYNGPNCGASAPDHMHFQAGTKFFMPLDREFPQLKKEYGHSEIEGNLKITAVNDTIRKFIAIESANRDELIKAFGALYEAYRRFRNEADEPLINLHGFYDNERSLYRIISFLREKHRPHHYFAEGDKQILLSPAAVDTGGVGITPRKEDFEKIEMNDLKEILTEVFVIDGDLKKIYNQFLADLRS